MNLLSELGFVTQTGTGLAAISWSEMESWLHCTGLELSNWEKLVLKEMSEVYASELIQATAKDRPAPYTYAAEVQVNRDEVAKKLKSVFSSFKRNANQPQD